MLGYIPNEPDRRDTPFGAMGLQGLPTVVLGEVSLSKWEPMIWNQGGTNSCVGQGMAAQVGIVNRQAYGPTTNDVSRLAIYTNSRIAHSLVLFDNGTYPRTAIKMMSKLGVPENRDWPFYVSRKNKRLPVGVRMRAHGAKGARYAFLEGSGDNLIGQIVQALRAGYPVGFGTRVSDDFVKNPREIVVRPVGDKIVGSHWMVITGARMGTNGIEFDIRNSWGWYWGVKGHCWMSADYITWTHSRDFTVIYGWESLRNARPDIRL